MKDFFTKNTFLNKHEKLVYLFLMSDTISASGIIKVSLSDISFYTGITKPLVNKALETLVKSNLVISEMTSIKDVHAFWIIGKEIAERDFDPGIGLTPIAYLYQTGEDYEDSELKARSIAVNSMIVKDEKPKPKPKRVAKDSEWAFEDFFNKFWEVYPRKGSKSDCVKAFKSLKDKLKSAELQDKIIIGASRLALETQARGTEKEFIPLPATWVRAQRWCDYDELDDVSQSKAVTEAVSKILPKESSENAIINKYFDEFWEAYPSKININRAKVAFNKFREQIIHSDLGDVIVAKARGLSTMGANLEYLPNPANWIEGERWNDLPVEGIITTMTGDNFSDDFENSVSMKFSK